MQTPTCWNEEPVWLDKCRDIPMTLVATDEQGVSTWQCHRCASTQQVNKE